MLFRILLAAIAFAGLSVPAAAQGCQRSLAPTVTFAEAIGEERPSTHCVEIEGVVVGRLLVEDEQARYRRERVRNEPSSTGAILGFYSDMHFEQPTRVRVIGRLGNCLSNDELTRMNDGDSIVMQTGFCHYHRGRIIRAFHVEPLGPVALPRVLPADRSDLGNLSQIPVGDVRLRFSRAAFRLFDAIRTGNRAAIATLHGGGPEGRRSPADIARVVELLLDDPQSPFAMLRGATETNVEILGWKAPLWADDSWRAETARTGTAEAIACFSTSSGAAMLWPIDSRDADNIPGRPYACTRIHISGEGADATVSFDTEQAESGAEEPIVIVPARDRVIHEL